MRNRRDDLPLTADINVTSLVDVAFTLLVIFIITAPALQGGIEIEPPKADVEPITADDRPFFVSVTAEGTVYVSETEITEEELRTSLPQLVRAGAPPRVYVRGDAAAPYERVLQVVTILNDTGTPYVLVGEPWNDRR